MHIFVLQVLVAFSCDILCDLLRPFKVSQGPIDAETCHIGIESFAKESGHIAELHAGIESDLITQSSHYRRGDYFRSATTVRWCSGRPEEQEVGSDKAHGAVGTVCDFGYIVVSKCLVILELTANHVLD